MARDSELLIFRSDFHKYRKIFRAILARLLLFAHACIAIWLTGRIDTKFYGIYVASGFLFLVETIAILYFRYGCEWKRVCTCFLMYLITMVPVLWVLRLNDIHVSLNPNNNAADNKTVSGNQTTSSHAPLVELLGEGNALKFYLSGTDRTSLVEQSMMILLIICRWLLPRGRIDRSSLSLLLIMYSALSADILDFSDILDRDQVIRHSYLRYVVLGVWSWSLVQFTVVTTTAFTIHRRRRQPDLSHENSSTDSDDKSEALSILMVFFMQDGPFLVTRCYAIYLNVVNYMIIFFSLKNAITLILALYRLFVLCGCLTKEGDDLLRKSEIARSFECLDEISHHARPIRKTKQQKGGKGNVAFADETNDGSLRSNGKKTDRNGKSKLQKF